MKYVTIWSNAEVHLLFFEHVQNWIPWLWTAETALHQFDWLVSTLFHTCQRRNVSHKNLDLQHKDERLDNLLNKASHAGMETKKYFFFLRNFQNLLQGAQPFTASYNTWFSPIYTYHHKNDYVPRDANSLKTVKQRNITVTVINGNEPGTDVLRLPNPPNGHLGLAVISCYCKVKDHHWHEQVDMQNHLIELIWRLHVSGRWLVHMTYKETKNL